MKGVTTVTAFVTQPEGYAMKWAETQYCSMIDPAL